MGNLPASACKAATPAKISGRIDDEALDRYLNWIDEETTALQRGNRCAGQIPSRGRSGELVGIGGTVAGYSVQEIGQTHFRPLEHQIIATLVERSTADTVERRGEHHHRDSGSLNPVACAVGDSLPHNSRESVCGRPAESRALTTYRSLSAKSENAPAWQACSRFPGIPNAQTFETRQAGTMGIASMVGRIVKRVDGQVDLIRCCLVSTG